VYLGKPILSVPIRKQFEQLLNALYVQKLGYGAYAEHLSEAVIRDFLAGEPEYAASVSKHRQDGNNALLGALDGLLTTIERGEASE
jgi:hypothetical protein